MVYIISYTSKGYQHNQRLLDCIHGEFEGWAILSPILFLVATRETHRSDDDIRRVQEIIDPYIEPSDKVFISLFSGQAIWHGYPSEQIINWLNTNLHRQNRIGEYNSEPPRLAQ